ncbi:MAG TPA: exopolysaccharide biosynthesis polyprenyl glycosylphosphotransferase, partial [Terriglobales bacterium]|nr:exopolysaccharide biosynthesis polyprenyl glycosylphosphotransferase [Terriglobales bacterium]
LLGALLIPLRWFFPKATFFEYATGAPLPLLGLAVLQAALITLVGHTEALYSGACDVKVRAKVLQKSVALSTVLVSLGAGLLTLRWATSGLCCTAGLLHLGALWVWRRNGAPREPDGNPCRNVLIVGAGRVGRAIAAYLQANPNQGRKVYGFLDDEKAFAKGVIGGAADLARLARTGFVDEVILAAPKNSELALQVLSEARRLRLDVEIVPELFGCRPVGRDMERIGGLPVICLHAEELPQIGLLLKRVMDILGAGIALLLLSLVLAAIAVLIKLDSRGPILYCAARAGRKGRVFRCYKFRTMVSNADELKLQLRKKNQRSGPFFKIASDPRVTRIGGYLRRYSLDELPQLWNVMRGEMSLVGPRPHPLDDVAGYEIEHLARLDVTPGMTGLWQVTARRDPSFRRGMELDREYIRSWSLGLDVRILMKTFRAVTQGSGD